MKQGSFPPAGLCCPAPSSGTTTPSDSLVATRHFPVVAGYRQALLPEPRRLGATEGLSSSHDTPLAIPRPLRRRVPWHPLQAPRCRPWPSPLECRLGSLLARSRGGFLTTPQASLDAADWPVAPRPASTPGSRPTPGAALPGTLASPRTGLTPAGCRELALGYTINLPSTRRPSYWTHIPAESPVVGARSRPACLQPPWEAVWTPARVESRRQAHGLLVGATCSGEPSWLCDRRGPDRHPTPPDLLAQLVLVDFRDGAVFATAST
jgi:hypothetical protein